MPLRKSISAANPIFRIFDTSMILRIVPSGLLLLKVRLPLKPTTSATSSAGDVIAAADVDQRWLFVVEDE